MTERKNANFETWDEISNSFLVIPAFIGPIINFLECMHT